MNAVVLISSSSQPAPRSPDDVRLAFAPPANDGSLRAPGAVFGPEMPLRVSFVGLSETDSYRALLSFPGGRRCSLAGRAGLTA